MPEVRTAHAGDSRAERGEAEGEQRVTKEEALQKLRELKDHGNEEIAHAEADGVLLELIGDQDITDAFEAIDKWYA